MSDKQPERDVCIAGAGAIDGRCGDPECVCGGPRRIAGGLDDWTCICGNEPHTSGFYPCNDEGAQVEPTPEAWPVPLYVCDRCGRIIHLDTHEVVGLRQTALES